MSKGELDKTNLDAASTDIIYCIRQEILDDSRSKLSNIRSGRMSLNVNYQAEYNAVT